MDRVMDDPDAWRALNQEFHEALYRGCGMPRLEAILASLWANIEPYIRLYLRIAANVDFAQRQHREIVALVRRGDGDAAAAVLLGHITLSREALIEAMQRPLGVASVARPDTTESPTS
jgi:DNA-binding GntR family transcriptional regulator